MKWWPLHVLMSCRLRDFGGCQRLSQPWFKRRHQTCALTRHSVHPATHQTTYTHILRHAPPHIHSPTQNWATVSMVLNEQFVWARIPTPHQESWSWILNSHDRRSFCELNCGQTTVELRVMFNSESKTISTRTMWREIKGLGLNSYEALGKISWGGKGSNLLKQIKLGL